MNGLAAVFMIAFIVLMIVVGPLLTIWALNTLFPVLAIPYEFTTCLAVIVLGGALRANVKVKKD